MQDQYITSDLWKILNRFFQNRSYFKRGLLIFSKLQCLVRTGLRSRVSNVDRTEILNVIGDVDGKIALTVDDEIDTAGSLINAVNILLENGAKEVYSCATHAIFSSPAIERIAASPVKEVIVTDTVPLRNGKNLAIGTIPSGTYSTTRWSASPGTRHWPTAAGWGS